MIKGKGTLYVDLVEFWEWVNSKNPHVELGHEVLYDTPKFDEGSVIVNYTFNSDGTPDDPEQNKQIK